MVKLWKGERRGTKGICWVPEKTMSSTYDLVEQDFIHEIPISTSNIQNEGITVHSYENDLVVGPHIEETPIIVEQGQTSTVTCSKKLCRILPTPICKSNLLWMRHERTCHKVYNQ